ncbi:MAG: alpha/beta hydrolase [Methylococcales bacterium]|nr:alpha/beta hydrolase [Methylococcales bacterium]
MDIMKEIPFEVYGSAENPPLIFAHANGYPPGAYRQFLTALGTRYHVLAMHHRPLWSDADPQTLLHWRELAHDLQRFVAQRGLSQQALPMVGHSLGAVAMVYAALISDEATTPSSAATIQSLTLIEPIFLPPFILKMIADGSGQLPLVDTALRRKNRWPNREIAFSRFRRKSVFKRLTDEALWDYVNAALKEDGDGFTLAFSREWEARFYATPPTDVWEQIPKLHLPLLGIRAAETDAVFPDAWTKWQEIQPQADFVEIEAVSHLVPMEEPSQLADLILAFLHKH